MAKQKISIEFSGFYEGVAVQIPEDTYGESLENYATCYFTIDGEKFELSSHSIRPISKECLVWNETSGFEVVDMKEAKTRAKEVVLYFTIGGRVYSPDQNDDLKNNGATETRFLTEYDIKLYELY